MSSSCSKVLKSPYDLFSTGLVVKPNKKDISILHIIKLDNSVTRSVFAHKFVNRFLCTPTPKKGKLR
jgi:hypothetical protein